MFHVAVNGVQQGPFNEAEIRERIARGELKTADLCWQAGWPAWRRIGEAFPAPGEPPPLPATAPVSAGGAAPQPAPAASPAGLPPPAVKPKTSGLATASLIFGICTIVLFPLFLLFMVPAIVCGHMALSKIKQSQGTIAGSGAAIAGLIMGYLGIVMVPIIGLMAAMAIPAIQKVRLTSVEKTMRNDARQIANAAQQYFLENDAKSVPFEYDRATGAVHGPLATYVLKINKGYNVAPEHLTRDDDFQLGHPILGPPRTFSPEGTLR